MDLLVIETVSRKLREIATTSNVTSNEAQWLVKGAVLLEEVRANILGAR